MKKHSTFLVRDLQNLAEKRLRRILDKTRSIPTLSRRMPAQSAWIATVRLIGAPAMKKLNLKFRGKNYPTDVLSFTPSPPFREKGVLGELVICAPVLRAQAREWGHSPAVELDILLIHGVLHLLGFDHEVAPRTPPARRAAAPRVMAKWESRLLAAVRPGTELGLINRANSDMKSQ